MIIMILDPRVSRVNAVYHTYIKKMLLLETVNERARDLARCFVFRKDMLH